MKGFLIGVCALALGGLGSGPARAQIQDPAEGPAEDLGPQRPELARYVFLPRVDGDGVATMTYGLGLGTRDTRFAGPEGVEQHLTVRVRPTDWLTVEAAGKTLVQRGAEVRGGGGGRLLARALDERRAGVTVEADAGYRFDLRGDHVLGLGATLVRHFGRVETVAAARVEVPLTANQGARDEADVLFSAAVSAPVTDSYTQGIELGAEDLEALWDPEEAEGGARVFLGPTSVVWFGRDVHLRANLSGVYAPPAAGAPDTGRSPWGVLARLAIGYSFR